MKVLIAGVDWYLGWPLSMHLTAMGHEVAGADCFYRRDWVQEMGSQSATPIPGMTERLGAFHEAFGKNLQFFKGDLTDYGFVENIVKHFHPDAIVHLGQMPSAPYSMIDVRHAVWTQTNNIASNLNLL